MPFEESQRDSGLKPRVARNELPWADARITPNPNGVSSFTVTRGTQPRWRPLQKCRFGRIPGHLPIASEQILTQRTQRFAEERRDLLMFLCGSLRTSASSALNSWQLKSEERCFCRGLRWGCRRLLRVPRVARSSQLWALSRNPFGIRQTRRQNRRAVAGPPVRDLKFQI